MSLSVSGLIRSPFPSDDDVIKQFDRRPIVSLRFLENDAVTFPAMLMYPDMAHVT